MRRRSCSAKNAPQFDESGKLLSDHEGEIVQGISGEAVRILNGLEIGADLCLI
jgi:hypothetical protein